MEEIPSKWRDLLGCRKCKRNRVEYIGDSFLRIAPQYLCENQKLVFGCACNETERDQSWSTTKNALKYLEPCYHSNAEEADIRIWMHVKHSAGNRKLLFSPDTDVYPIGLINTFIASDDNNYLVMSNRS